MAESRVFANANLIPLDRSTPPGDTIAVNGDRIAWVGPHGDLPPELASEEVDLGGATVVPGFVDAHHHVMALGYWMSQINCLYPAVKSIDDIVAAVRERAAATPPGEWILGRGYDDNKLAERRHLTRHDLDVASPGHPVLIRNVSGHMSVANSFALRLAGITGTTTPPFGGHVVLDDRGEPTGLLQEKAQDLLGLPFLPPDKDRLRSYLAAAGHAYLEAGITSGHEAGIFSPPEFTVFQQAWADGTLPIRTYMMIRTQFLDAIEGMGLSTGFGDDRLRVGSLKVISDGSLIGRTAAVCHPYDDAEHADDLGLAMFSQEELDDIVWRAHRAGWQVAIHAIGDRAIDMCLDAYEAALARMPRSDHRHRIEHCGVMRPDIIDRMARMGVIPVGQPPFIAEFGDGFMAHLGEERCQLTYPLKSLLDAGLPACGSSDSPVSSYQPLFGIQAAVTEQTESGEPFAPREALTVEEALRIYTRHSAYAAFDEDKKGSITPGKYADLAVLGRDPRTEPPETLARIPVLGTVLGGELVHQASMTT